MPEGNEERTRAILSPLLRFAIPPPWDGPRVVPGSRVALMQLGRQRALRRCSLAPGGRSKADREGRVSGGLAVFSRHEWTCRNFESGGEGEGGVLGMVCGCGRKHRKPPNGETKLRLRDVGPWTEVTSRRTGGLIRGKGARGGSWHEGTRGTTRFFNLAVIGGGVSGASGGLTLDVSGRRGDASPRAALGVWPRGWSFRGC